MLQYVAIISTQHRVAKLKLVLPKNPTQKCGVFICFFRHVTTKASRRHKFAKVYLPLFCQRGWDCQAPGSAFHWPPGMAAESDPHLWWPSSRQNPRHPKKKHQNHVRAIGSNRWKIKWNAFLFPTHPHLSVFRTVNQDVWWCCTHHLRGFWWLQNPHFSPTLLVTIR